MGLWLVVIGWLTRIGSVRRRRSTVRRLVLRRILALVVLLILLRVLSLRWIGRLPSRRVVSAATTTVIFLVRHAGCDSSVDDYGDAATRTQVLMGVG